MILRIFEGLIAQGREAEFHQLVRQVGLPDLERTSGCVSAVFARSVSDEGEIFTVASVWSDWQSLQDWTGGPVDQTVFYQDRRDLLARHSVRLFEVVDGTPPEIYAEGGPGADPRRPAMPTA